jgi:phosphoenolpyruvate-protein kinase (PTS system EI component)
LSMNSASTAKIKMELAQFTLEDAEDVASAVMFLKTQKDIVEYLSSV